MATVARPHGAPGPDGRHSHGARRRWPAVAAVVVAVWLPFQDADADDDVAEARDLEAAGQIVPLDQVLAQARLLMPGRILEVELEHEHHGYVYEVKILDKGGQFWELEFDAVTGRFVEQALEHED